MSKKQTIMPWLCESCGNRWVDGLFVTWVDCPECGSEAAFHEQRRELREDDEWYVEGEAK